MNAHSQTYPDGLRRLSWTLASIAILASAAPAVGVAGDGAGQPESISATVSLADLDLATDPGKTLAQARIVATARKLCRQFRDSSSLADRDAYADCRKDAQDSALKQLRTGAAATAPTVVGRGLAQQRN